MSDPALTTAVVVAILTAIGTAATVIGAIIQHRRTPKPSEPPITPVCTTVLGVDMYGHVRDLPGYSRRRPSRRL